MVCTIFRFSKNFDNFKFYKLKNLKKKPLGIPAISFFWDINFKTHRKLKKISWRFVDLWFRAETFFVRR